MISILLLPSHLHHVVINPAFHNALLLSYSHATTHCNIVAWESSHILVLYIQKCITNCEQSKALANRAFSADVRIITLCSLMIFSTPRKSENLGSMHPSALAPHISLLNIANGWIWLSDYYYYCNCTYTDDIPSKPISFILFTA